MLERVVASGIFCARNIEKTNEGHVGRAGVAAGQSKNIISYVKTLDNEIGRGTKAAVDAFKAAANGDKLLGCAYKAVDIASKHINPLICVSAGIDVLQSDDKESALITNTAALGAMFAGEHWMKKHLKGTLKDVSEVKGIDKITKEVTEFASKYKHGGKLPAIVEGATFVLGSCLSYGAGQKFGTMVVQQAKPVGTTEQAA